jgi:hypothetical protein
MNGTEAIRRLSTLIQPLAKPDGPVERRKMYAGYPVALDLPIDYCTYLRYYGAGTFRDGGPVIQIFDLTQPDDQAMVDALLEIARRFGDEIPEGLPVYPEAPGVLPWGCDDQGYTFLWWTEGPADDWPVVADERVEYQRYPCQMGQFLLDTLTNSGPFAFWTQADVYPDVSKIKFKPARRRRNLPRRRWSYERYLSDEPDDERPDPPGG